MGRFVQGEDRRQDYLLPASLDDYVSADNPVRAVEAFIDALDLKALAFAGITPADAGRPAFPPATMLKSISTAISTGPSRAGGSSAKRSATSR